MHTVIISLALYVGIQRTMQFTVSIVRRKFISDVEKKPLFVMITSPVMQLQQPSVRVRP